MKQYDDRDGALPVLAAEAQEGVATFRLAVTDVGLARGGFRVRAVALFGGERAGLSVVLAPKGRAAGPNPLGLSLQPAAVELIAEGEETDVLLRAVAAAFGVPLAAGVRARPRLALDGIAISGDVRKLASRPARVKLFHAASAGEEGFELLTSFNLPEGTVTLMEKWTGYRASVVKALTFDRARDAN